MFIDHDNNNNYNNNNNSREILLHLRTHSSSVRERNSEQNKSSRFTLGEFLESASSSTFSMTKDSYSMEMQTYMSIGKTDRDAWMNLGGPRCRLQTCSRLATEWFDSTFRV
ncbi:hypothetical protein DINM_006279 [Dirofilaria immitis]|nr:hypothetical protein [Dirofilaria immitis]